MLQQIWTKSTWPTEIIHSVRCRAGFGALWRLRRGFVAGCCFWLFRWISASCAVVKNPCKSQRNFRIHVGRKRRNEILLEICAVGPKPLETVYPIRFRYGFGAMLRFRSGFLVCNDFGWSCGFPVVSGASARVLHVALFISTNYERSFRNNSRNHCKDRACCRNLSPAPEIIRNN